MSAAILLTNLPAVVDLKCEFSQLDEREQVLKSELDAVRNRKAEIARLIFNQPSVRKPLFECAVTLRSQA